MEKNVDITPLTNKSIALSWEPTNTDLEAQYKIFSDMGTGYGVYIYKARINQPTFVDRQLRGSFSYRYKLIQDNGLEEILLAQIRATTFSDDVRSTRSQSGVSRASVAPVPTSLPADAVLLGLISDNDYVDEFGTLTIVGELRNDSNSIVADTDVSVTFYDTIGTPIGNANGETVLDTIRPGEKSPFIITLTRPAGFATYSLRAFARPTVPEQPAQLDVVELRRFEDDAGFFHIRGVIENVGNTVAKRVKVAASIYGRDNGVINVGFTYVNPPVVQPGERATYDVIFAYYPRFVSQQVFVFEN